MYGKTEWEGGFVVQAVESLPVLLAGERRRFLEGLRLKLASIHRELMGDPTSLARWSPVSWARCRFGMWIMDRRREARLP